MGLVHCGICARVRLAYRYKTHRGFGTRISPATLISEYIVFTLLKPHSHSCDRITERHSHGSPGRLPSYIYSKLRQYHLMATQTDTAQILGTLCRNQLILYSWSIPPLTTNFATNQVTGIMTAYHRISSNQDNYRSTMIPARAHRPFIVPFDQGKWDPELLTDGAVITTIFNSMLSIAPDTFKCVALVHLALLMQICAIGMDHHCFKFIMLLPFPRQDHNWNYMINCQLYPHKLANSMRFVRVGIVYFKNMHFQKSAKWQPFRQGFGFLLFFNSCIYTRPESFTTMWTCFRRSFCHVT